MAGENEKDSFRNKNILIPERITAIWQRIVDIMSEIVHVPAGLIMRVDYPNIEVFVSSKKEGNPYNVGDKEVLPGLYCETVMKERNKLLIPNATKDPNWKDNPDIKLGMISYLGFPIEWPDKDIFGTLCILDNKENKYNETIIELMQRFKELIEFHLLIILENDELITTIDALKKSEKLIVEREIKLIELNNIIKRLEEKLKMQKEKYGLY